MLNVAKTIPLLGKSERDTEIKTFLHGLGITQPLKRPSRDEFQVNIEIDGQPIELCFVAAESPGLDAVDMAEGELIFNAIFVTPGIETSSDNLAGILPFGLDVAESRSAMRKKLGNPEWSSPLLKNDRWIIDGCRVLICFSNDESSIRQIVFSVAV